MRLVRVLAATGLCALGIGCEPPAHWEPPAPAGRTWQYEAQGAVRAERAFGGGAGRAGSYGYFFGGKSAEVPPGTDPDQFWRQQSAASFRFNLHLQSYGERVTQGPRGPRVGQPAAVQPAGAQEE
ncbi:MAG TPA: hypothetical protein VGQ83_18485 [Polyangia bacterium]|jgi:hypothetical protein